MKRSIENLKLFQYGIYFVAIFFLISTMVCDLGKGNNFAIQIPYENLFPYFFPSINFDLYRQNCLAFFLVLQTFSLLIFFLIALFLGLKILPRPLSEIEKAVIIQSPFQEFNKIFFSKILFGRVGVFYKQSFDMRNIKLNLVADLYLLHFKLSNKGNGLLFLFLLSFLFPYLLPPSDKALSVQLLINFFHTNLVLFLLIEFILLGFSKSLIKGEKIG